MTPVIVTLIIIGVVLILVSCFMIDKSTNIMNSDIDFISSSYVNSSDVKRKVEDTLLEVSEDTVSKTEDELSKISNEKIIAVNDFSNIVLDKITTNHEEVVFLYNMLNEKEAEIKEIISKVDQIKQQTMYNQQLKEDIDESEHDKINNESEGYKSYKESERTKFDNEIENSKFNNELESSKFNNELESSKSYNELEQSENDMIFKELGLNNNQSILKLHKQGKSVVEIAKELKLGQGEVKLVIDLYR